MGGAIDREVGFYFLVEAFCGSIRTGVIGSGVGGFDSQELEEFPDRFCFELLSSVRNEFVG